MLRSFVINQMLAWMLVLIGSSSVLLGAELQWPQWRGPAFDGSSTASEVPVKWDASSVLWKSPLKGKGQSSPVLWDDRIFLTSALEEGKQRVVMCLSARDGSTLWEHVAWQGEPEPSHKMNGWASATCATDGKVVVAFFGRGGLHAYSIEGKPLWSRDLGRFESPWGVAACPLILGNLVVQNGDSDKNAFIEAFDLQTGKTVWRQTRPDHRGWSSPIRVQRNGHDVLILNGHTGVTAYAPTSGAELWFVTNPSGRGEPTVTPAGEYLYVVCGLSGNMSALRLTDPSVAPQSAWTAPRKGGRDLPSPIVVDNFVIVCSMNGIATCYDARQGSELWKERLQGQFSSSPIAANGLVYYQNEAGETIVIQPGPSLKIIAQNSLNASADELFRASLTPANGRIYSRSDKFLYCIAAKAPASSNPK